jgi:CheY-like chemotaxis protein
MTRLLIADDQIPNTDLSSEKEVRDCYLKIYPHADDDDDFAEGFVFFHRLIHLLRERAYEVDCASTPAAALEFAKRNTYDAVILDLGWYTMEAMPYPERMILGWQIADQIRQNSSAPILMFSARFYEDDELARTAAEKGLLPVYKTFDEECQKHLLVTIRWATLNKTVAARSAEERQVHADRMDREQKNHALWMYRWLSNVLLSSIAFSVILLGTTAVFLLKNDVKVTVASAVFGLVSTFISSTVYQNIGRYQKSLT